MHRLRAAENKEHGIAHARGRGGAHTMSRRDGTRLQERLHTPGENNIMPWSPTRGIDSVPYPREHVSLLRGTLKLIIAVIEV